MAERIAILGGEPYAEWIKRDGPAQRLFKAYCEKWPDGTSYCAVIGSEFYVRFNSGDGMRHVDHESDFDCEYEWCAYCGTPIDPDGCDYYGCDHYGCDAVLCDDCSGSGDGYYCPQHNVCEMFQTSKEPDYTSPYEHGHSGQFTFGVEIEIESELNFDFEEIVEHSDLIAGWNHDPSLGENGVELQTNILDMSKLNALQQIVEGIPDYGENAGGHIHVARTPNQCASRWYWALHGLNEVQCGRLNMRHMADNYWCELRHGDYTGKHTAINDDHTDTIELRTFDCWYEDSASNLVPAVKWVRAMWRFFEKHTRGTLKAETIERYSSCMANNVIDAPRLTLSERLNIARHAAAAQKYQEERERREMAAKIRRTVEANVGASRYARETHGSTRLARNLWEAHEMRRARRREKINARLSDTTYAYAFPSRDLQPLHVYLDMATVEHGESFRSLSRFRINHAATGNLLWEGYEYWCHHGNTAQWVIENILRSRRARASHGKPTVESLERTALRLYKRAGRPELSARYVQIRKRIAERENNWKN